VLGSFIEEDMSFIYSREMGVSRILVNLNLREGLLEYLNLISGGQSFKKKLDYEGIPFMCRRCHQYDHNVSHCNLSLQGKSREYGGWPHVLLKEVTKKLKVKITLLSLGRSGESHRPSQVQIHQVIDT
jgi:hypothetical protein